jgi:predicted AlkP superfamily pyrophosphatase or phosphodiesterase
VDPVLPDYSGPCIAGVVPALLHRGAHQPSWLPDVVADAAQVVLLVLDGLGWEQLQERPAMAPTLSAMSGGPIASVVPTTTATALTSIVTGRPPAEHGTVGYRVRVDGPSGEEVLNILRWRTHESGDARPFADPSVFQSAVAFEGTDPPVVTRAEFVSTGFTEAMFHGGRFVGWRMPSTLLVEVRRLLSAGEPFVYAYYDGIDKTAHEYGLGEHYEAEVAAADRLVADLLGVLPPGAALVVTADHGQVDVGKGSVRLADEVMAGARLLSGEGRFRWVHTRAGAAVDVGEAALGAHGDQAWIVPYEQMADEGWFGGPLSTDVRRRLGDIALVAREPVAFLDPGDTGEASLCSRHGSLTSAEVWVPLLASCH